LRYIVLYIFVLFSLGIAAQQDSLKIQHDKVLHDTSNIEQKKFDSNHLDDYKADSDFNYKVIKRKSTLLERIFNWLIRVSEKFLSQLFGNEAAKGILAIIIKVLPYVIGGIVLLLLIKFFLKVNITSVISGKTNKAIVNLTDEEALIKNEDLSELIQKAIHQKNYRLAIRYYYLLALQKLSKYDFIDWQQQKTNEDYIKEIQENKLKNKFASSTYLYDFVWYGNFDINESEFTKAEAEFNELNKLIK